MRQDFKYSLICRTKKRFETGRAQLSALVMSL